MALGMALGLTIVEAAIEGYDPHGLCEANTGGDDGGSGSGFDGYTSEEV